MPSHHVGDPVVLAGDPGREDVRVVPARHRRQGVGRGGTGPVEIVAIEARTDHGGAGPAAREATEGAGHLVHDGHAVALLGQAHGQPRTDPTASHDDHVHRSMQHAGGRRDNSLTFHRVPPGIRGRCPKWGFRP